MLLISSKSLVDLRIAEISGRDMKIENGKVVDYRARVKFSLKDGTETSYFRYRFNRCGE